MKIMFVSDVHGSKKYLEKIRDIYKEEMPNKTIFLGDIYYGGDDFHKEIEDIILSFQNCYVIKGNCDSQIDIMTSHFGFLDFYYFEEFGKKIFCSHGNIYNISRFPDKEFDCLVYGHTHFGLIINKNNKYFLNPGSITSPRSGSVNSYMILDDNGIYLKDLERNIIEKLEW